MERIMVAWTLMSVRGAKLPSPYACLDDTATSAAHVGEFLDSKGR
jgi:hypothetical protein